MTTVDPSSSLASSPPSVAVSPPPLLPDFYHFENELPFLAHPAVPLLVSVVYITLVYAVTPALVKKYRPVDRLGVGLARKIGAAHNAFLSVGSVVLLVLMIQELYRMFQVDGLHGIFCDSAGRFYNGPIYFYYMINHLFKWYELADTLLIQIHGKRPGFLQVYHHAITLILTWVSITTHSSMQWLPITLNLCVHGIMYGYFAGMELQWPKPWWRHHLTRFQILQFIISLVAGVVVLIMRTLLHFNLQPKTMPICQGTDFGALFGIAVLGSFLVLFVRFFHEDRLKQQARKKEEFQKQQEQQKERDNRSNKNTSLDSTSSSTSALPALLPDTITCSTFASALATDAIDAAENVASAVVLASSTTNEDFLTAKND